MGSIKYLVTAESIPDTILPSQFFESVGAQTFSSEKRLMLAVLADAINLLRNSNLRRRNSFNEAWSWVFANRITGALSFDHVCDVLGLDAESLRRRLTESVSEHGTNVRRLRLSETGRRHGPTVNRIRRR